MGDATSSTTIPGIDEVSMNEANTDPDERLKNAFVELTHNLELYVIEQVWEPTFHEFLDPPIKLRDEIYQEHFLDN
jgi:hypothetical protein